MTVAHVAAKTKKIRLGTAVCILPLYHPARLLAEIGFVDTVSNGRLDLGVGSGYQEFEFERFGVNIAESGDIYNEFMDVLPLGLTQKTFELDCRALHPTACAAHLGDIRQSRHIGPGCARKSQLVRDSPFRRQRRHEQSA
jgi:alkanesulfonate monooxygenase SsuD/methylene tetrahydromethanopterin reductase-like flavin-dependent oxidoreductase (luciferase family)